MTKNVESIVQTIYSLSKSSVGYFRWTQLGFSSHSTAESKVSQTIRQFRLVTVRKIREDPGQVIFLEHRLYIAHSTEP